MTPTAIGARLRSRPRRARSAVIHRGGQACAQFARKVADSIFVIAGLVVLDVAAYLWHLEAGLVVTAVSLFALDFELGT